MAGDKQFVCEQPCAPEKHGGAADVNMSGNGYRDSLGKETE